MTPTMFLLLIVLFSYTGAQLSVIGTLCDDQLRNLYKAKGLPPSVANKPTITYETGYVMPGNVSYVSILLRFGQAASEFQRILTNYPSTVIPVSYVSFDIPLCATNITMTCVADSEAGMTNKTNCSIGDEDTGYPSLISGRMYVHLDYLTYPCNGIINVTFMNTVLIQDRFTTQYIYDVSGIVRNITSPTGPLPLNTTTAKEQYRTSGCTQSDGSSLSFAITQKQLVCAGSLIGCNTLNQITAVAPPDFSITVPSCTANLTPPCVQLNGSASNQTGTGPLFYQWTQLLGYNLSVPYYDNITCNTYASGLFNTTSPIGCAVFRFTGLYQLKLTVYDGVAPSSSDTVFINVIVTDAPLILPNSTITPYPLPPPKTGPPIDRPVVQFPTSAPQVPATLPPITPRAPVNTTVASLFTQYPPPSNAEIASLLITMIGCALLFVLFTGIYIVMMPSEWDSYLDRIYYS